MSTGSKLIGVLVWAAVSIILVLYTPLFLSTAYLLVCAIAYQVWKRRDTARREADLDDADDTRRSHDDQGAVSAGPAGKGYGGFSWGRRR